VAFATREETMLGLRADWVRPFGRPNRIYPFGRVCVVDGCWTRLSIYNGSEYCWVHEPVRYPRARGKRMVKQAA
jgi:hypothetical protein